MKEEYNYTLTVPVVDIEKVRAFLEEVQGKYPMVRISRKPDRGELARYYLCFPFSGNRTDNGFPELMKDQGQPGWELFGPNYGVWGLS